jgi:hypothetical protein
MPNSSAQFSLDSEAAMSFSETDLTEDLKEMSTETVVLVVGAHGVSGRAAAEHWASLSGTVVYGLSRRCVI